MRDAKTYRAARRNEYHKQRRIGVKPWSAYLFDKRDVDKGYAPVMPTGKVYRNKGKQEAARRLARMSARG